MATAIAVGLALFVLAFAWLFVTAKREQARRRRRLADSACPGCGAALGVATADAAERDYVAACEASRRARPDLRINFARKWPVRCTRCDLSLRFAFETGALER